MQKNNLVKRIEKYSTEADLVNDFMSLLQRGVSPWGPVEATTEWDYRTGVTDVLVRTRCGDLVAFEAKLSDWRRAAHQAYRNTTFARKAYVVMPQGIAERAVVHSDVFLRYGVGLCSVTKQGISVLIDAPGLSAEPLLPWMHKRAQVFFDSTAGGATSIGKKNSKRTLQSAGR